MFKKMLKLSDQGAKDLNHAIVACVIANLTMLPTFAAMMGMMLGIIDPFLTGEPLNTGKLWMWFGLGILFALIYAVAYKNEYDKTYTTAYSECETIRIDVAERMRKLPMSFFNRKDLSELTTNIMGDCASIEHTMSHVVPSLIANVITVSLTCIMLGFYDWRMALAMFAALPISFGIVFISKGMQKRFGEKHVKAKLAVSDQVQEYLEGIKVVKAFGLSGEKSKALERALRNMRNEAIKFEGITGIFITLGIAILQTGIGLVTLIGVNLLTGGTLGIVPFLTFVVISVKIYGPITTIMTLLPELFYLLVATKRMQTLRDEPVMNGDENTEIESFDIEMKNVTFAYNKEDVIKDMSLTIPRGGVTALVGPSGSGKSTLSRLVARFWDINKGEITIGGKNIRDIDPERLMHYMSFVFQDVVLFNDTVMNNIKIGKADATDKEAIAAAKLARCDDFIREMPEGYQTLIGENGSTLSGGERQRISIARALLKDAPIVLLDEATASLDPENEVLIQQAISALIQNRTVIVIAHRLKTVAGANKIVVLEDGKLLEQGTHEELLNKNGLYSKLWHIQQESLGWSV